MKKIAIKIEDDNVTIDFGGDLDNGCCGCEAQALNDKLKKLGIDLKLKKVFCRLPVAERIKAKMEGRCSLSPLKVDSSLGEGRLVK